MSRNGQIWADGVQFIQTLTWISTATTTSTTNLGAYPYTLYVYIYVYVHESIDSTAKNKQQHTTACTKPRQMQRSQSPWIGFDNWHSSCFTGSVQEIAILSTVSDWALSWRDPPPPGPGPPHPAPALTPGVTDTGHSPSSPATLPYSVSPLTSQFFGIKTKLQGHSQ